jgi:glucokinase
VPAALGTTCAPAAWPRPGSAPARGERHVLFVAIGTGIAAAHVVDGRVSPERTARPASSATS